MKYIVYKTTNKVNNKIYVGVHKLQNEDDTYIGCGCYSSRPCTFKYPKTPFQAAVKKYGAEQFIREVLYTFDTPEQAYTKEQEIVTLEFIQDPNTYNIALGGNGGCISDPKEKSVPVFQFSLSGELIKRWDTSVDAAEFFEVATTKISCAVNDCLELFGYFWSRSNFIDLHKYRINHHKYTYLYNKSGKFIQKFESRTQCASFIRCCPQSVSKAIKSRKSIKGYYVSDNLQDEFKEPSIDIYNSKLYLYDGQNLIGYLPYTNILAHLNLKVPSQLTNIIIYNNGWYKNYYISELEGCPTRNSNSKKINVYDKQNNFIETCASIKDTKEKYKLNSAEINRILKGIKTHEYYIFKYANDIV